MYPPAYGVTALGLAFSWAATRIALRHYYRRPESVNQEMMLMMVRRLGQTLVLSLLFQIVAATRAISTATATDPSTGPSTDPISEQQQHNGSAAQHQPHNDQWGTVGVLYLGGPLLLCCVCVFPYSCVRATAFVDELSDQTLESGGISYDQVTDKLGLDLERYECPLTQVRAAGAAIAYQRRKSSLEAISDHAERRHSQWRATRCATSTSTGESAESLGNLSHLSGENVESGAYGSADSLGVIAEEPSYADSIKPEPCAAAASGQLGPCAAARCSYEPMQQHTHIRPTELGVVPPESDDDAHTASASASASAASSGGKHRRSRLSVLPYRSRRERRTSKSSADDLVSLEDLEAALSSDRSSPGARSAASARSLGVPIGPEDATAVGSPVRTAGLSTVAPVCTSQRSSPTDADEKARKWGTSCEAAAPIVVAQAMPPLNVQIDLREARTAPAQQAVPAADEVDTPSDADDVDTPSDDVDMQI